MQDGIRWIVDELAFRLASLLMSTLDDDFESLFVISILSFACSTCKQMCHQSQPDG
jgi:hypothetical protein